MSLIPSTNAGAPGQPYYIANDGTVQAPIVDAVGVVNFGPDANGDCFLRSAASAPTGAMALGANSTDFNHLVLTSGPKLVSANAPVFATQGLSVSGATVFGGSVQFTSSVNMTTTAPSLKTQTIPGVLAVNTTPITLPQPVLTAGLYAIGVNIPTAPDRQVYAIGYWNGTIWSIGGAVSAISTLGPGNSAIHPSSPATSLTFVQSSGGDLNIPFVYYTQLAAAFS